MSEDEFKFWEERYGRTLSAIERQEIKSNLFEFLKVLAQAEIESRQQKTKEEVAQLQSFIRLTNRKQQFDPSSKKFDSANPPEG